MIKKAQAALKSLRAVAHKSRVYHTVAHPAHSVCHLTYFWLVAAHYPYYQIAAVLLVIGVVRLLVDGEA